MAKLSIGRFGSRGEAEQHFVAQVNAIAEGARQVFVTPGAGQAMAYEAKHQEALAGDGPMLQAEADALGVTVEEVAQSVLSARAKCRAKEAKVEAARMKAKKAIRSAPSAADMHRIAKALDKELSA